MLVVSPHLDDAVFSCGALLSRARKARVVTVFAGAPRDASLSTDWDRRCGWANAGEAVEGRRREDAKALALLGAVPVWLDFCDSQYGAEPSFDDVVLALRNEIESHASEADPVLLPLGLFHSDHRLAHEAGAVAVATARSDGARSSSTRLYVYEDSPYRSLHALLQRRLVEMAAAGISATPAELPGARHGRDSGARVREVKRAAVAAYESQLRAFGDGGYDDVWRPERYWLLEQTAAHDHA